MQAHRDVRPGARRSIARSLGCGQSGRDSRPTELVNRDSGQPCRAITGNSQTKAPPEVGSPRGERLLSTRTETVMSQWQRVVSSSRCLVGLHLADCGPFRNECRMARKRVPFGVQRTPAVRVPSADDIEVVVGDGDVLAEHVRR